MLSLASLGASDGLVRFAGLNDGRCLTAEAGIRKCGISLAPCQTTGPNATLQQWRLESTGGTRKKNGDAAIRVFSPAKQLEAFGVDSSCIDEADECKSWASQGECQSNPVYMHASCKQACGKCKPREPCVTWSWRAPPDRIPRLDESWRLDQVCSQI